MAVSFIVAARGIRDEDVFRLVPVVDFGVNFFVNEADAGMNGLYIRNNALMPLDSLPMTFLSVVLRYF